MTRIHFEAIAQTLKTLRPDRGNKYAPRAVKSKGAAAYEQWSATVVAMAQTCQRFNAGFQVGHFFKACDYQPGE